MSNKPNGILDVLGEQSKLVNVGHGNSVSVPRIVAVLEAGSLPMKRLRDKALERNLLIDATAGRKVRSLIVTDSQHVILSAMASATVQERLQGNRSILSQAQLEIQTGELVS